jgi:hypothetical protein
MTQRSALDQASGGSDRLAAAPPAPGPQERGEQQYRLEAEAAGGDRPQGSSQPSKGVPASSPARHPSASPIATPVSSVR